MYSWSIVSNKHTSITKYDCIDLNFRQINTVIECRVCVLWCCITGIISCLTVLKCCYRWVFSYNFSAWVYGIPLYVGLLTTGVVLLHHKYIYKGTNYWKKSWPIHYKKGPSNFIDMGPWAHTLLFLGNTLHMYGSNILQVARRTEPFQSNKDKHCWTIKK